jgi:hypothetical protein
MIEMFQAGGFPMLFVLATGLAALVGAALHLRDGDPRRLEGLRAWTRACLASVLAGTAADLAAVARNVPAHPEWTAGGQFAEVVLTGIGESMSPAILGGALLSLAWMLAAVGVRRARAVG